MSANDPKIIIAYINKLKNDLTTPDGLFPIGEEVIDGIKYRVYKSGEKNLGEYFLRGFDEHADKLHLVFEGERLTYGAEKQMSIALAHQLYHQFGVKKGDRVAIATPNCPEFCICYIASVLIGAIPVALNSYWMTKELTYGLTDCAPNVYLCDEEHLQRAIPYLKDNKKTTCILIHRTTVPDSLDPSLRSRVHLWRDVVGKGKGSSLPLVDVEPCSPLSILYTSGSTGVPKGVLNTHLSLLTLLQSARVSREIINLLGSSSPPTSVNLLPIPLFHATGLHHIFVSSFIAGSTVVMMRKWDAGLALKLIQEERVTGFTGVPTLTQDLLEHPDFKKFDTSSLVFVSSGGASNPPSQVHKVKNMIPSTSVQQGYGLTETSGLIAGIFGPIYLLKPLSTGLPIQVMDLKFIDPDTGKEVAPGQPGELMVKGPTVMKEYWNKPEETKLAIVSINGDPGWLHTGDIAKLDEDGYLYIVDRAKDIIIRGGENISSVEVEAAFYQNTDVMECAAVPLPHARWGEVIGFVVVLKPGCVLNVEQLLSSVKGKLSNFKIPESSHVFISSSPLPRGPTAKINKLALKQLLSKLISGSKL